MRYDRADAGHRRIATLDIETTHFEPTRGETVAIGVGVHERGDPLSTATLDLFHRQAADDEATLIGDALAQLDEYEADYLVTFNGRGFDFDFLADRLDELGAERRSPAIDTAETHLDLFHDDRKDLADDRGEKWPSLEESLAAYGHHPEPTTWRGEPLDNARFGDELGPAYLDAVRSGDAARAASLRETIIEYLRDDLRANLRLYYYDIGALDP